MDIAPFVEVRVAQHYRAPADRVFDAWIDPAIAGNWLFATASRPASRVAIDARPGGAFRFVERTRGRDIEHSGEYLELVRPRRLSFTLTARHRPDRWSRVTVDIVPQATGCRLALVHENVLKDEAPLVDGRWAGMLYGLNRMLP